MGGKASTGWTVTRPKSSNDPSHSAAIHTCDNLKRCKDTKELKERLTAWSLKVVEYEHQLKASDEAQKTLVVEGDDAEGHQTGVPDWDRGRSTKSWRNWRSSMK